MKAKARVSWWALVKQQTLLNVCGPFACSAGVAEPISVIDNNDGSHTASYTPASDGAYTVCVKYADQEVPCRSVSQELTMYLLMQLFKGYPS